MTQTALPFTAPAAGFILVRTATINGEEHRLAASTVHPDEEAARAEARFHLQQDQEHGRLPGYGPWHVFRVEPVA